MIPALIAAGGGLLSGLMQGDIERKKMSDAQKAYQEMLARSEKGEAQFLAGDEAQNAQLEGLKRDLASGANEQEQEALAQGRSNLVSQGVRGGQASTQLNRMAGNFSTNAMRDINRQAYEQSKAKQQYFANKGAAGFNLQPKSS